MFRYKAIIRKSPDWKRFSAAILGVSVASPNWQGDKFSTILKFANDNFEVIRIDVTDALYRHNFMANGMGHDDAMEKANALGALWLARHRDIIEACSIKPTIMRWADWYHHKDFEKTHAEFQNLYLCNSVFRDAICNDVTEFFRRRDRSPSLTENVHATHYLIEEVAVATLQARIIPSLKLYPGEDLECLNVVRRGLVDDAPKGLENEQFAKVKLEKRQGHINADSRVEHEIEETGLTQSSN